MEFEQDNYVSLIKTNVFNFSSEINSVSQPMVNILDTGMMVHKISVSSISSDGDAYFGIQIEFNF